MKNGQIGRRQVGLVVLALEPDRAAPQGSTATGPDPEAEALVKAITDQILSGAK